MKNGTSLAGFVIAGLLMGSAAYGQAGQAPGAPTLQGQGQKPQSQTGDKPLTLEPAPPPVNAEEDAAFKAFQDAPSTDVPKKLQLGDDFLAKYPQSRYRAAIYNWDVMAYMNLGQIDKMTAVGQKDLELMPEDAQTMAIMGSTLPRSMNNSMTPEERQKILAQAEQYSRKALEIVPTLTKPTTLTDEQFITAKNQIQAMAYSGLGLVAFRRNQWSEAIPNLEQSVKYDPNPDPVNYFLLGVSNEKASHFEDAIAAYTRCAAIQSSLTATCKSGIEEAKKLSTTQLSVPK
jgi:tetratricopeptide (TPR) repeat protein